MFYLRTRYILFGSLIHAVLIVAALVIYNYSKVFFVVAEVCIVLSLFLFISFYRIILRPVKLLEAGIESIANKDFSMKFLPVGQPELDRMIDVYNKMIEQLRLERANTIEKNFFLEKLIIAIPAGIIILNKNGNIQSCNPAASKILFEGKPETLPILLQYLPYPWNIDLLKLNETDSVVVQINGISQYKCYRSFFIDKGIKQSFFIIEELTNELLKAEKQSYEKVIRMMSHEVNNSIGAANSIIDSTVNFMKNQDFPENKDYIKVLNIAKERIINLNYFTKRFADIVHMPPPNISKCDLKEVFNHVLICFKTEFERKQISVTTNYTSENTFLLFDYQQLELVLTNIIRNAVESITTGGMIEIAYQSTPSVLTIGNTGEKISPEVRKKLFEPFFSTKKTGQGIGLILIREILTNHKCSFSLETQSDGITQFKIVFKDITLPTLPVSIRHQGA